MYLQELFRYNLLDPAIFESSMVSSGVSRVTCMMMSSASESGIESASVPLYELCYGVSNHSNAFGCAVKCGKLD